MRSKIRKEILKVSDESTKTVPKFYKDLEHLEVELLDFPVNPYKMMVEMSLFTWGSNPVKWDNLSPESRFYAAKEVLERRALPLALESAKFSFRIVGITRACADQIMRSRIGVVFAAKGFKDNDLTHLDYIVPHIFSFKDQKELILMYKKINFTYGKWRKKYPGWAARYIQPMGSSYSICMSIDLMSLMQFCANRMETTEQPDIVAVAWLLRERLKEKFPLIAEYLRPACDIANNDRTVAVNGFADILGLPHNSDGRCDSEIPEYLKRQYQLWWNAPCTDIKYVTKILRIKIPARAAWKSYSWEGLDENDKRLFESRV